MVAEAPETSHTVVIMDVRDETTKKRVARTLEKVTRNASPEDIRARLNKLPWTLTRSATQKRAARLYRLLDRLGATVKITPPLPPALMADVAETQILPGVHMLSDSRIASATQFISDPKEDPGTAGNQRGNGNKPLPEQPVIPPAEPGFGDGGGFEIEPLNLGGILDRGFQICRGHFWKLFAIVAIPWLITMTMFAVIAVAAVLVGFSIDSLNSFSTGVLIVLGITLVPSVLVIAVVLFYLSQGALIHAVSSIYLGREILIGEAYRFVLSKLGKFLVTSLLFLLAIFAFTIAPVMLGVVFYILCAMLTSSGWWSAVTWLPLALLSGYCITKLLVFDKVVIIEDIAYGKALSRSWSLLTGKAEGVWPSRYWVRFSLLIFIFILINLGISLLFQTPATVVKVAVPQLQLYAGIVEQVLSQIGNVLAGLFNSVCMVVFYYDIRNRKEGFDLKMLSSIGRGRSDAD
ncbi:MAG: hypothetical protein V1792_06155 [Pseudomonadota bacterium]